MSKVKALSIEEYINSFPLSSQKYLHKIRDILKEVAPNAKEQIKWGQPCFKEKRILFSFSAYKTHINFMPTGQSMKPFLDELKEYKLGQDTVQFKYDEPLPIELIKRIATHRYNDVINNDAKWMYK